MNYFSDGNKYDFKASESEMWIEVHAGAVTNTTPDSMVIVQVERNVLSWKIPDNTFGDKLPVIPSSSRAERGKILYHLPIKVTLKNISGNPVPGRVINISSNRTNDSIKVSGPTDASGCATIVLETRDAGGLSLEISDSDIVAAEFSITLNEAWYENTFLITGYHVCFEGDFNGDLVMAHGINDLHKRDFLYGARGVVMQGTGKASNGRYIRPTHVNSTWHRNTRGNRDYLANPDGVTFAYIDTVQGAYGLVMENHSIAVDPGVIPKRAQVDIEMVGRRFADDTGSAIIGNHIDNFVGAGAAVQAVWERGPVNNTRRKVKYLGTGF